MLFVTSNVCVSILKNINYSVNVNDNKGILYFLFFTPCITLIFTKLNGNSDNYQFFGVC